MINCSIFCNARHALACGFARWFCIYISESQLLLHLMLLFEKPQPLSDLVLDSDSNPGGPVIVRVLQSAMPVESDGRCLVGGMKLA